MSIFKTIFTEVSTNDKLIETLLEEISQLIVSFPTPRLGISETFSSGNNVKKGDIVIHRHDKRAYVLTGEEHEEKQIIGNRHKRQAVNSSNLIPHHFIDDSRWKGIVHKIANKHPNRGVYFYDGQPKSSVTEGKVNLCDQSIPTKDKGITTTWKKPTKKATKKSHIHNNKKPYDTSMKQAGKVKKHIHGDKDPGNPPSKKKK